MSNFRPVSSTIEDSKTFIGPAYTGVDVRAFVLPTYKKNESAFYNTEEILSIVTASSEIHKANSVSKKAKYADTLRSYVEQREEIIGRNLAKVTIPNLAGISISRHRDKAPVHCLGFLGPRGFIGSRRTTAGTLIFWLGDMTPISALLSPTFQNKLLLPDEIPLFDLYITFINDQGAWSSCMVQGMTILDEGTVIEPSSPEGIVVTYSYMAMSSTPIMPGYFSVLPVSELERGVEGVTIEGHFKR